MARTTTCNLASLLLLAYLAASGLSAVEARRFGETASRIHRVLRHVLRPFPAASTSEEVYHVSSSAEDGFVQVEDAAAAQSQSQSQSKQIPMAMAPAPGPVPGPNPPTTCPPTPDECDFYFNGSQNAIPTFNLATQADTPISPPIVTSVQGNNIQVYVFNTANAEYICSSQGPNPSPDNQFYTNGAYVQARVFQTGYLNYINRYVRLNITSVELDAYGAVININPGQGENYFPENRRCVIFKTTA